MRVRRPLLLVVWLISVARVAAGELPPLTLAGALRLAQENNISLRIVREEEEIASAGMMEARAAALPHLDLGAEYVRLDDVPAFTTGEGVLQMGRKDNYEASLEASQVLFAGGGVMAGIRQAGRAAEAAGSLVDYASLETAYAVHALFNRFLLSRREVEVARGALELSRQNRDEVKVRFEQGLATKFDRLRSQEQVSRAAADLLRMENALRIRRLELLRALGLALDDPRPVIGSLQYTPVTDLPADPTALALGKRPDLCRLRQLYAAQEEALARARSGWWPTVVAFGQYRYANPTREYADDWEDSWLAGVRLECSVFDGLLTEGHSRREKALLRQAGLRVRDLEESIRKEVAASLFDLETAAEVVVARQKNLEEAAEALRLAQRGYEEGIQQQIDVLDAQQSLTRSRSLYAAAVYEHVMARVRLDRATGTLTEAVASFAPDSCARKGVCKDEI